MYLAYYIGSDFQQSKKTIVRGRNRRVPLISDSDRRVPADWGQESQASSCVEAWNSACLSRCPRGERPLVELSLEPGVFVRTMHGKTAPSCWLHSQGDLGSIPGSGRSPGEGNGNPLQYSCLENSMDGGAWWATVHGVTKSRTWLSNFTFFLSYQKSGLQIFSPDP